MGIWAAAGHEDALAVTSKIGEPVLTSMADANTTEGATYIGSKGTSAFELFKIQKKRAVLRKEYLDHWQNTRMSTSTGRPVDAIISPVAPFPPPPHGQYKYVWLLSRRTNDITTFSHRSVDYTLVWNVLDYPACVFPVTKVDSVLDRPKPPHKFLGEADRKTYELCTSRFFVVSQC